MAIAAKCREKRDYDINLVQNCTFLHQYPPKGLFKPDKPHDLMGCHTRMTFCP